MLETSLETFPQSSFVFNVQRKPSAIIKSELHFASAQEVSDSYDESNWRSSDELSDLLINEQKKSKRVCFEADSFKQSNPEKCGGYYDEVFNNYMVHFRSSLEKAQVLHRK